MSDEIAHVVVIKSRNCPKTRRKRGITCTLDKKKCSIGVFIYLKKASDTVDHQLLNRKLEVYGIRGNVYNWISSYLNNRCQFVNIYGDISVTMHYVWSSTRVNAWSEAVYSVYQ